ncbi:hypothetical protein M9458_043179, partial [Cirrhinus mrigala]
ELEPAATDEPLQLGETELMITMRPELRVIADQVRELATTPATREKAVASEIMERSSTHCTMAEGELLVDLGLYRPAPFSFHLLLSPLPFVNCLLTNACPPTRSPAPASCSTSPLASWLEDSPWLLAPSSPLWPGSPLAPPGSLGLSTPLLRLHLIPLTLRLHQAPSSPGFTLDLCRSGSTAAFRIHPFVLPRPSGSSSSPWLIGFPSPPQAPPPPPSPPSPFLLHGSSICWLHRGSPTRLWPGSHLAPTAPSPSSRLPDPPWFLLFPPWLLSPSSSPWTLFVVLLPGVCPPLKFPPVPSYVVSMPRGHAFREGGDILFVYLPMCC